MRADTSQFLSALTELLHDLERTQTSDNDLPDKQKAYDTATQGILDIKLPPILLVTITPVPGP
jgi:hypothetical protein